VKKPIVSELLVPVFISITVFLISSLIARSLDLLTIRQLLLGAAATVCLFLILTGFVLFFQSSAHQRELENVIAQLSDLIPPSDFPWLYSDAELAKAEEKAKGDEIWIVSPDLSNVTEKPVIINAVKSNIKRRVKYTYIVPDAEKVRGVQARLKHLFASHPNQLRLVWVPEAVFFLRSITHYAIFNVTGKGGLASEAYLELPIIDPTGKRIRGYWIKVSDNVAASLVGRFLEIVEKYGDGA